MKLVIFGATGFSGQAILKLALSKGFQVTVLVRNKSAITIQNENLTVIQGNVLDSNDIKKALEHQDAVIQCLGVGGKGDGKPTTFISDATKIIVEEMEKQQIKRLITLSNVGAGNSLAFQPGFSQKLFFLIS
jgi:putative NADH-flavin reductase